MRGGDSRARGFLPDQKAKRRLFSQIIRKTDTSTATDLLIKCPILVRLVNILIGQCVSVETNAAQAKNQQQYANVVQNRKCCARAPEAPFRVMAV